MRQSKSAELSKMLQELHHLQQQHDISHQQQCRFNFDNLSSHQYSSNISELSHKTQPIQQPHQGQNNSKNSTEDQNQNSEKISFNKLQTKFNTGNVSIQNKQTQNTPVRLGQMCRKSAQSKWDKNTQFMNKIETEAQRKTKQIFERQITVLKQQNRKLFEDNKNLMLECINLKKQLSSYSGQISNVHQQKQSVYLMHQINRLKTENIRLKSECASTYKTYLKHNSADNSQINKTLEKINEDNSKIWKKLQQIQVISKKNYNMKNSNGFTSTEASKYSEDLTHKEMINSFVQNKQKFNVQDSRQVNESYRSPQKTTINNKCFFRNL